MDGIVELASKQIIFAREYTKSLLTDVQPEEWFLCPPTGTSHLAWQIGHLAMAQYGLTMLRIRGKQPEDSQLISNDFIRAFKRGSQAVADPAQNPPLDEILSIFERVHAACLKELEGYHESQLQEALPLPYAVYPNKLGSILFCPAHEMLHAGQIGMLRRLLGKAPVR